MIWRCWVAGSSVRSSLSSLVSITNVCRAAFSFNCHNHARRRSDNRRRCSSSMQNRSSARRRGKSVETCVVMSVSRTRVSVLPLGGWHQAVHEDRPPPFFDIRVERTRSRYLAVGYERLSTAFEKFAEGIKAEQNSDGQSLSGLEEDLSDLLTSWGTDFQLDMKSPSMADIIKTLLSYQCIDKSHGKALSADQFGSGFQRHFIYSLIQIGAKYVGRRHRRSRKTSRRP